MTEYRRSYWKTVLLASLVGCALLALLGGLSAWAWLAPGRWTAAAWALWGLVVLAAAAGLGGVSLAGLGGLIALRRDALEAAGRPYIPARPRESVQGIVPRLTSWARRALAALRGRPGLYLRPGEWVEVRSLEEILRTLDSEGMLNGLPFMPEMTGSCGRQARVLRRIEKLNDYPRLRGLRRMHDIVLLEGLRCDGGFHGGCQANCQLRWHEAWLRRARGPALPAPAAGAAVAAGLPVTHMVDGQERFVCQVTQLAAESTPIRWSDPRAYLGEWLVGNVRLKPFLVGVAIALFRWVQARRSGACYPMIQPRAGKASPQGVLNLCRGELVRVKTRAEIELTLNDRLRNRGLYFDNDMLRYCGGEYRVRSRVERLIVERTGELVAIKNPSVTLEGTTATGEYYAFNPENEQIFWREIWLERVGARAAPEESPPLTVAGTTSNQQTA